MGFLCCVVALVTTQLNAIDAHAQSPVYSMVQPVVSGVIMPQRQEIVWHENLESGWRESRRTGRPMVIFITSARCRYCDVMKNVTWRDNGVESRVGNEFVAVRLSPEHNPAELSRITVDVYPTTLVAAPQGKVIEHRKGFQPPELLHELLNRATFRR
jgi:hypothetical protein